MRKALIALTSLLAAFILTFWFLSKALDSALIFLILAFMTAYLSLPFIHLLEKKGVKRFFAVSILFLFSVAILCLLIFILVPPLLEQIQALSAELPDFLDKAFGQIRVWIIQFNLPVPVEVERWLQFARTHLSESLRAMAFPFFQSLGSLAAGTMSFLVWIMNLALFPVFFFFLAMDYERLSDGVYRLIPLRFRPKARFYFSELDRVLAGYFRGQLIVCVVLAVLYGGAFWLIGVPYGAVIGVIGGLMSFIPYVGGAVAVVGASIVSLAAGESMTDLFLVVLSFSLIQSLESFVLSPKLVGNRVGLTSLASILVLIAGANFGGFVGMMIALPVAGFFKVIVDDLLSVYRHSAFYQS